MLTHNKQILVGSIETLITKPKIYTTGQVNLPARAIVILNATIKGKSKCGTSL